MKNHSQSPPPNDRGMSNRARFRLTCTVLSVVVIAATIFVDNITRFTSDITQPTIAKKLYDGIKDIRDEAKKRGIDITFVLVAHTSNDWSKHKPINISSIAVADTLTTGMDSIWAIGATRYRDQKLFKIVTGRNIPEPDKVVILERTDEPFLCFKIVGTAAEDDVLPTRKSTSDSGDKGNKFKGTRRMKMVV